MAKPTTVVSFAYNKDINGAWVWNDISSYVLSVSINRGKSNDLDAYSSGTLTVTLNNRSRTFEPNYSGSPYYGQIEPYGQVKVVTSGYTEFVGVIDNWSYAYDEKGLNATAEIKATDNMANLAKNVLSAQSFNAQLSGSRVKSVLYGADVMYSEPACIDPGTRTITADTVAEGTNVVEYIQKIAANDGALFYARRDGILAYKDSSLANSSGLTTVRTNLACNSSLDIAPAGFWTGGSRSSTWAYQGTYSYTTTSSSYAIDYTETNAAKYLINTKYNVSFYIKGGSVDQEVFIYSYMCLGGVPVQVNNVYQGATQTITIPAGTVQRINMGSISSTAATDGITFGVSLTSRVNTANAFYVDAALIEQGVTLGIYFDGRSTISPPSGSTYAFGFTGTADNSSSYWNTTITQINDYTTFTSIADANNTGIKFNDLVMAYATEKLFNQITINGVQQTTIGDSTSQTKYGIKEYAVTNALLDTQVDNDSLAAFLLASYKNPNFRADSIQIALEGLSASDQNSILAMDLMCQITLKVTPGRVGSALVRNYLVIGINHNISLESHMVELKVTSMDAYGFVLDHPTLGILDTSRLV